MGESISTIQRSLRTSTSYKFAAPRYRLPPMASQTVQVSVEPRLSTARKIAQSCRKVVPKSLPVSATTFPTALSFYIAQGRCERISAIQAVLKSRTVAIRKGNKHQLGLSCSSCLKHGNEMLLGDPRQSDQRTSPSSSITRPCCSIERSSAKLLVFTCTRSSSTRHYDDRLRTRRRVGSTRRRGNQCMITRDFSVI